MAAIHPETGRFTFNYNISRPYPFKWFTPVAIIVLAFCFILFSLLNFLITGYYPQVVTSSNPNATENQDSFLRAWPLFFFNVRPTCQVTNLPVGTRFFTNQTALTYTLQSVWQQHGAKTTILSSIPYFNNVLDDCKVQMISLEVEKTDLRNMAQISYTDYGTTVRTYVQCSTQTPSGPVMFNLTQDYNYVPPDITMEYLWKNESLGTNFIDRNKMTRASLWWGESILSIYWGFTSSEFAGYENQTKFPLKGMIFFGPYGIKDVNSPDFFRIDFRFLNQGVSGKEQITYPGSYGYSVEGVVGDGPLLTASMLKAQNRYPEVWRSAEALAKSAYSTVLIDLGQSNGSNILTDPALLQLYSTALNDPYVIFNAAPGPARKDYNALKSSTGPLGTTPSVISTEYICSVPRRKSFLYLIVSILVADIVFMQVVWWLLRLFVEYRYLSEDEKTQCQGCHSSDGSQGDENEANNSALNRHSDESTSLLDAIPLRPLHVAASGRNPGPGEEEFVRRPVARQTR